MFSIGHRIDIELSPRHRAFLRYPGDRIGQHRRLEGEHLLHMRSMSNSLAVESTRPLVVLSSPPTGNRLAPGLIRHSALWMMLDYALRKASLWAYFLRPSYSPFFPPWSYS